MDISIIIPVYNAEKYLKRCVNSVLKSLKHSKLKGEILLVDNNSTDKSPEIAQDLEKHNQNIINVLQCKTPGASATRNFGTKKARGKYLWFIDADDEISEIAILSLTTKAKDTNADFVVFGINKISRDKKKTYLPALNAEASDFKERYIRSFAGPWGVFLKREWWIKNFEFKEGIIHEDMELMPTLILHTDKFASIDKPLYTYYFTPGSVLHKDDWDPKYLDIFPALESLYNHFKKADAIEKYHDSLEWFFVWNLLVDSAGDFKKGGKAGRIGFKRSREMLKKYFPNWRKNYFLNQKKFGFKFRVRVNLNYFGITI